MEFPFVLAASNSAIRLTLGQARDSLLARHLNAEEWGRLETVLAEALNNIVEHACRDLDDRRIALSIRVTSHRIIAQLRDDGHPLPESHLPEGVCPTLTGMPEDLPEGGFGWFLIRTLCDRVAYARVDDTNCLTLYLSRPTAGEAE